MIPEFTSLGNVVLPICFAFGLMGRRLAGQRVHTSVAPVEARPGEVQALTPTIDVIFTPDIDASLDAEGPKREFWRAFRAVGGWYEDLPPY